MRKYSELQSELDNVFTPKKKFSLKYSRVLESIGEDKRASRVRECGTYLEFNLYDDDSICLHRANFCSDPLCPQCAKRKSLKMFSQVSAIVERLQSDYQFLFVTLTIKNPVGDNLSEACDALYKSYIRLMDKKRMKFVKGALRSLEITVNRKTNPITYHPHLHCIFAVKNDYFSSSNYLSQSELSLLWQDSLKVDYIPIVDIRACKDKGLKKNGNVIFKNISSAVAEVAKYSVKASDFLCGTDEQNKEVVKVLLNTLKNRRMFSFTGVFREVRRELKLDDIDTGDLVHIESDNSTPATLVARLCFSWLDKRSCYFNVSVIEPDILDLMPPDCLPLIS